MNLIDTSAVNDSINREQPFLAKHLTFMQKSTIYMLQDILIGLIGSSYSLSQVYILWGCVRTGAADGAGSGASAVSEGAIFYFGEIFYVAPFSTTNIAGQYLSSALSVTNGPDDPAIFSDNSSQYVENVRNWLISQTNAAGATPVSSWIPYFSTWQTYNITNGMLNPGSGSIAIGATAKFMYLKRNKIVHFQLLIVGATVTSATVDNLLIDLTGLFGAGVLDTAVFHGAGSSNCDVPQVFDADIYDFSGAILRCNFNVGLPVGSANRNIYCNGSFAIK